MEITEKNTLGGVGVSNHSYGDDAGVGAWCFNGKVDFLRVIRN